MIVEKKFRTVYRPLISAIVLIIFTFILSFYLFTLGPWPPIAGWVMAIILSLLTYVSPKFAIILYMLLLSFTLIFTSTWLALFHLGIFILFLLTLIDKKNVGLLIPLVLLVPLCLQNALFFLPTIAAILFYEKEMHTSIIFIFALYITFWTSIVDNLPLIRSIAGYVAPYQVSNLTDWFVQQVAALSDISIKTFEPWFIEHRIELAVLFAVLCISGFVTSKVKESFKYLGNGKNVIAAFAGSLFGGGGLWLMGIFLGDVIQETGSYYSGLFFTTISLALATRYVDVTSKDSLKEGLNRLKPISLDKGWNQIAGYDDVKNEIRAAIAPYNDISAREQMKKAKLPLTKGILLYGPPGVGKTLFARVIATEARMSFVSIAGSSFFSKWVGESEKHLREIFQSAREKKPCVIFFDELEAFLNPREDSHESYVKRVVSTFLAEMDGFYQLEDILVVGATNYPNLIDTAAIRPGRFDKIIYIPPPDKDARKAIWEHYLKYKSIENSIDINLLVDKTYRYTAADIEALVNEVYRRNSGNNISTEDLTALIDLTKPTITIEMLEKYEDLSLKYGRRSINIENKSIREKRKYSWDDFAGMEGVKNKLKELVEMPLTKPEFFKIYKIRLPKGALLYGPPGCGKTLLAKVLADECDATFLLVSGPELLRGNIGESEKKIRELFRLARENKPAIIFFDEIDAIAQSRDIGINNHQVVNQMLTEMDGMDDMSGVFVLAATNRPNVLDPALLRAGRFDTIIYIGLPDEDSRNAMLQYYLKDRPMDVSIEELVALTRNYTGAEIEHIINEVSKSVALEAYSTGNIRDIKVDDFVNIINRTPASISEEEFEKYESFKNIQR